MLIRLILSILLVLPFAQAAGADDPVPEWLQYESSGEEDYDLSVGIRYERKPDGTVDIDVASMAAGKGADFRRWEAKDIRLDVGGEAVRPVSHNKIYGSQESVFRYPAAVVFGAIGAAYGIYGKECPSSGSTCPVTGASSGGGDPRGAVAKTIDTAGMAAGLALLTAQAKGEVTGEKASFTLTSEDAKKLKGIKLTVEHKTTNKKTRATVPIKSVPGDIFKEYVKTQPGMEHTAGVAPAGTLIIVTEEEKAGSEGK